MARRNLPAVILIGATLLGGCAGKDFVAPEGPLPGDLRLRAETVSEQDIRVSATILSRSEATAIFGVDLSRKAIQPVWIEIENGSGREIYFLRTGLDPEYFAPREAAFALSESMSDEGRQNLVEHLDSLDFRDPILPGATVSGFVLTNSHRESKFVTIDLISEGWSASMTLVVSNPERSLSGERISALYAAIFDADATVIHDQADLRRALEVLPCCVADKSGAPGEPLNVVIVGAIDATAPALIRRGFRYEPATPFYLFGRPQDLSLAKGSLWVRAQPHVLRLWLTDLRYEHEPVWIGQISTPKGGRFAPSPDDGPVVIEPNVDVARDDFVQDAFFSQGLAELGFVAGAGAVPRSSPRETPAGSSYYTDGLRAVLFFDNEPTSLTEIEFLSWERLLDHRRP